MAWIVFTTIHTVTISQAETEEGARKDALEKHGLKYKPYLARDWKVRVATEAELRLYANQADNRRPSQPTAKVPENPGKAQRKLFA